MNKFLEYCNRITRLYNLDALILFGSLVKDQYTQESDIDLLIIQDTTLSPEERFIQFAQEDQESIIQPFIYTLSEIYFQLENLNMFFFEILEEGLIVYQYDENIIVQLKERLQSLKKRYDVKRKGDIWMWQS